MTKFTDNDINGLKGHLNPKHGFTLSCLGSLPENFIVTLLARLEAAEKALLHHTSTGTCPCTICQEWRKVAGK